MTIFFLLTVICNHFDYVLLFLYKSCNASWYQFHPTATLADRHETLLGTIARAILYPVDFATIWHVVICALHVKTDRFHILGKIGRAHV